MLLHKCLSHGHDLCKSFKIVERGISQTVKKPQPSQVHLACTVLYVSSHILFSLVTKTVFKNNYLSVEFRLFQQAVVASKVTSFYGQLDCF